MSNNQTDLNQYVKDAVRTESRIETVRVNPGLLIDSLTLYISAGEILDQIKKHAFYGKQYDLTSLSTSFFAADIALNSLSLEQHIVAPEEGEVDIKIDSRVFHAIIGLATESTELCEALLDSLTDESEVDVINLLEELGDLAWYQAVLIDTLGGDWANILNTNIAKLRARYPEKFTSEHAINRDLDTERKILEGGSNENKGGVE